LLTLSSPTASKISALERATQHCFADTWLAQRYQLFLNAVTAPHHRR
jgi:hypothetical protein